GPPPPIADLHLEHLEHPEGLGPGLPLNIHGLPSTDPLAQTPLIDLNWSGIASQQPMWPWQQPTTRPPSCTVICIGQDPMSPQPMWPNLAPPNAVAPAAPAIPPGLLPGPPGSPLGSPPGLLPGSSPAVAPGPPGPPATPPGPLPGSPPAAGP